MPQIPAQPKGKLHELIPWLFAFCWRCESRCFPPGVSILRTIIPVDFSLAEATTAVTESQRGEVPYTHFKGSQFLT